MNKIIACVLGGLFASPLAFALSLGDSQQQSWLGEPLQTSIPLHESGDWADSELKIDIEMPRGSFIRDIKATITSDGTGRNIVLSTQQPVNEPYVDLTLTVTWPEGGVKRSYEMLLDPPGSR